MEKNKGIFPFRKHPVGELLDGKKERKRKESRLLGANARKMHRALGMLLAAALVFNTLPANGLAVSASEGEKGLCEHHTEHTAECGYKEAKPCTHEHGEECYTTVTECVHMHTDECYPEAGETEESTGEGSATDSGAGNREPSNCTHVCKFSETGLEESGCIIKVLDCHHEHDESCGYQEAQECGYVCEICNGTESENTENNVENDTEDAGIDTAECICETLCTEDSINRDCPVCGAEGADLSACKGKEQGNVPEIDTGEKTEEQEKTGEKVITAWEWIDPEEYLTDGMLALPGAGSENPAFMEDVTTLLPEKIQAEVVIVNAAEDGEETEEDAEAAPETEDAEITLTGWKCASYPEDGAYEGTYTFTASLLGGFVLAEDAAALKVEVELGGAKVLAEKVSASYQEASWNGSEVTYTGKTENCTSVESSTEAVTWNAGWYVVSGTVTISEPITVTGAVNLILADGCALDAQKGIVVETGNSLTIYVQSGGSGTLTATGTVDSDHNASAGIGGSGTAPDSGAITIHGGVINATGGGQSRYCGGAGIGGGSPNSGNGGNSGAITIYGGTITANSGEGDLTGAGIGGGSGEVGGAGSNITIYGGSVTAASTGTGTGGAGIGGGGGFTGGGTGSNIQICSGMVNATGGARGAGIGGGGGSTSGDGTNITISGGTVKAVGGNHAAGIGGGGGYSSQYASVTGGTGSVTISGGIVDAKGGAGNSSGDYAGAPIGNGGNAGDTAATVSKTNAIVFENGAGTVCGDVTLDGSYNVPAGYTLNIPAGASLSGSGTLSGGSAFTTENLTADMISVPTDLYYTGADRSEDITTRLSGELTKGVTICGQTFTVGGWTLAVEKAGDLTYTATYTNNNDSTKTFTKTITLLRSGTDLADGKVKTYNGETETTSFTAGDTITVKATPTATGAAPQKVAARLLSDYIAPTAGQMALFVGDVQVSKPVGAGTDGTYTMTVSASEVLLQGNAKPNGNAVTLTAKFVENDNMADAAGTVDVKISAVAMAEKDGTVIDYYGESNLADAFAEENDGATVTLLGDVALSQTITLSGSQFTLSGGGHTITYTGNGAAAIQIASGTVTLSDCKIDGKQCGVGVSSGTVKFSGCTITAAGDENGGGQGVYISGGDVTISGGTYSGTGGYNACGVEIEGGKLTISGGTFSGAGGNKACGVKVGQNGTATIRDGSFSGTDGQDASGLRVLAGEAVISGGVFTGSYYGVYNTGVTTISGGTFNSEWHPLDTNSLLAGMLATGYAYYRDDKLIKVDNGLSPGTVTVWECDHTGVEVKDLGNGKHGLDCPYCGYHSEHTTTLTATASGNNVTLNGGCGTDGCGYQTTLGTASFTFPKVTYGQSGDVTCAWDGPTGYYGKIEVVGGSESQFNKNEDENITERSWTLAQLFGSTKVTAGEHKLKVSFFSDAGVRSNACELDFKIDPAPLTADMVTLTGENATYNGTEQKPTLSVQHGGTTLTEGTDYEVRYTRDGVVTNDFTSAGTITITVTGMANYTGTVTKTFTIGEATLMITWSNTSQELTYTGNPAVITEPTITLVNNENFKGTISYSYKKEGENVYKNGRPTAAGTYTVKAHVDAADNYAAANSTNELTLTIKKADAEITVKTDAYNVDYGAPAFTISGVTNTNPETVVQYAVTEGTDVVSVSNGTVTIRNAGTATITVSLPETANYNAAEKKTITVGVAKKGGYTVSEINKKYYYDRENTAEINLAALLPRDCGTVTYGEPVTSGNVTFTAKAVENGMLSYALAKGNVNDAGTITVTVTTRNYEDITVTVKVALTDQISVELKEGTEVTLTNNILIYGESLSKLGFNKAIFVDDYGDTVEGVLAWKDAAAKPDAGTASAVWMFTPADKVYFCVEGTTAITVNKAVPSVSETPTAADRVYNPSISLKNNDLSGAAVTGVNGSTLEGTWGWQSADIVPAVNNSGYVAVFTPKDTTNYETVTRTITVNVTKATPYIAKAPTAADITYGETLNDSPLTGGTVQYGNGAGHAGDEDGSTVAVTGTFTWKEPVTKPVAADSNVTEYTVVFTPSDTANYNPVEAKVTLTVNKAQNAPDMPGSTMDVSNSLEKVGDILLPEGWEWQASDQDTALEVGKPVSAVAVYTGADKGNYEKETVMVAITRSACDHVAGDVIYTGVGEMAPTCTEAGLGHRECTKCGFVIESEIAVPALGHDYVSEVTKEPTALTDGEKTYTCSRCGNTYTEPIPHTTPEGLWISGLAPSVTYTGSAMKPEGIRVYHGSTLLREKTEYTISYKNNTRAGTAQVIVTGKGSYTGKATAEFTIEAVDLSTDTNISAFIATAAATGKNLKPSVTVTWNGKKLKEKTDYTLTYEANIKTAFAEGYDVTISGKGNYTGAIVRKFRVVSKGTPMLNSAKVTGLAKSYPYQEGKEFPDGLKADLEKLSVKVGKTMLTKDDYTVRVENGNVVGTGVVVLEAAQTSDYAGEKRISFNIIGTNLKKCYITGLEKTYPYTGKAVMPEIKIYTGRNGTGTEIPNEAYTVRYSNYINQGKATVTVTGKASKGYSGSIKALYTIGRLNLAAEESAGNIIVTMPTDIKYAKGGAKPQPAVTHTDRGTVNILREGVDYTLKYSSNTAVGRKTKPTLKITGIGNYCGIITKTFDIGAQDIGTLAITAADKAYSRNKKGSYYYSVPKVYDLDGKQLKQKTDYTVQYFDMSTGQEIGKNDIVANGAQIRVTITASEKGSYTGTLSTTYYVRDAKEVRDIAKARFDKIASQQYTGNEIRPEISLYTQTGKTKNYLTEEDYEIIGYYNNVKKGTATILIRGTNAYSGVKSITFKITAADSQSIWSGIFS